MNLQREQNNRFDRNDILVKIPRMFQMAENERDNECQARTGIVPLWQMAGQTVAHVPANLCPAFNILQERGLLLQTIAVNTIGRAQQSVNPPVWAR